MLSLKFGLEFVAHGRPLKQNTIISLSVTQYIRVVIAPCY